MPYYIYTCSPSCLYTVPHCIYYTCSHSCLYTMPHYIYTCSFSCPYTVPYYIYTCSPFCPYTLPHYIYTCSPFPVIRSSEYTSVNTVPHYVYTQVPLFCQQVVRVHHCQHSASLYVYTSSPFLSTDRQSTFLSTQCLTICVYKFPFSVYRLSEYISVNTASLYVYTGSPFLSTVGESTSLSAQCLNDNYYMYTHVPLSCLQIVRVHLYLHSAILRVHMLGVPTAVDG